MYVPKIIIHFYIDIPERAIFTEAFNRLVERAERIPVGRFLRTIEQPRRWIYHRGEEHVAKRLVATHEYNMGINKSKRVY